MDKTLKKAVMLLHSLILHYHGLDKDEKVILNETARSMEAVEELEWANGFIAEDYITAFERSRAFFLDIFDPMPESDKLHYLLGIWNNNAKKGYVTEMETAGMMKLAKDWSIEKAFKANARKD